MKALWDELNLIGKSLAVLIGCLALCLIGGIILLAIPASSISFEDIGLPSLEAMAANGPISHVDTPEAVKAIYMTACTASSKSLRDKVLDTIKGTQINSIVLDLKDYTGTISYVQTKVQGPRGRGCKISDLPAFIGELHKMGIYTIARVTVFQDPLYSLYKPNLAVQSASAPGTPWKDRNGLSYIDPSHSDYWSYPIAIAREAHKIGFDEINFDYIRFPSDGDMSDAVFAIPEGSNKAEVMRSFFKHLHGQLSPEGIITSADLFGQTTVSRGDMGIGQILEDALPYFDYIAPMDYPSHYIKGFMGYDNPAEVPGPIILETMMSAVERAALASQPASKLRPWLQAFDLGAVYTPEMVRAQIQAVYDAGLTSWMLWDPANRYNREAL